MDYRIEKDITGEVNLIKPFGLGFKLNDSMASKIAE
jgi:hypothetical protein